MLKASLLFFVHTLFAVSYIPMYVLGNTHFAGVYASASGGAVRPGATQGNRLGVPLYVTGP